jgi:hypothetical protein
MLGMETSIRLVGAAAIIVALLFVGSWLYDKDSKLSTFLLLVASLLAILYIASEIYYKHKKLWLQSRGYLRLSEREAVHAREKLLTISFKNVSFTMGLRIHLDAALAMIITMMIATIRVPRTMSGVPTFEGF